MLATDALASDEGFRAMVLLTFEHLFGMRSLFVRFVQTVMMVVEACHVNICAAVTLLQRDGFLDRVDAVYTSIESQTSLGSLHAHSQLFVQCLHQHTSLHNVLNMLRSACKFVVREYVAYKTHVCRQVSHGNGEVLEYQKSKKRRGLTTNLQHV